MIMPKNIVGSGGPQIMSQYGAYDLHARSARHTHARAHTHTHTHNSNLQAAVSLVILYEQDHTFYPIFVS